MFPSQHPLTSLLLATLALSSPATAITHCGVRRKGAALYNADGTQVNYRYDNARLLRAGRLSAVLHHDLRQDMRTACQAVMRAHDALPVDPAPLLPSAIQVVTPYNMPPESPLTDGRAGAQG